MTVFLDTSVLIASFYDDDPRHPPSFDLLSNLNKRSGAIAAHSLAETYASLTGMPGKYRVSTERAVLYLGDLRERLRIVALDEDEYNNIIKTFGERDITGGGIYDALLAACAMKAKADILYTWNIKDFSRLGPPIAGRVKKPGNA